MITESYKYISTNTMLDYNEPHVKMMCKNAKSTHQGVVRDAVYYMASLIAFTEDVKEGDILIPAPQHNGAAQYTLQMANLIASFTHAKVMNVLRCKPHIGIYEAKKKGLLLSIQMYITEHIPQARRVLFVDNVIDTGATFIAAKNQIPNIEPLTFATTNNYYKLN